MRNLLNSIPGVRGVIRFVYYVYYLAAKKFSSSDEYWKQRYQRGGNSGGGSYGAFAEFKAGFLNGFVTDNRIASVIEFGSGDGNQLTLASYPAYTGVDISPDAIALCRKLFANDPTKQFLLSDQYAGQTAELSLSLDVIYHLVEDAVFSAYMQRLFAAGTRYVIIYSSNTDQQENLQTLHVRHRKFTDWIEQHQPRWRLERHLPNKYPYDPATGEGTPADFFVFSRV
jgi:SAM-dependent methyltransferase